jgi:hypothetical protein
MKPMRRFIVLLALLPLMLTFALGFPAKRAGAQAESLAVIMASKSKITNISMAELNRIFRGMLTRNDDGDRFMPLNQLAGSPHRAIFERAVLGMTPDQSQAFWIDQKIRAAAPEPRTVNTVPLAVKLVGVFPGAITYVPAHAVTAEVKILRVDGKLPTDPGYPLR